MWAISSCPISTDRCPVRTLPLSLSLSTLTMNGFLSDDHLLLSYKYQCVQCRVTQSLYFSLHDKMKTSKFIRFLEKYCDYPGKKGDPNVSIELPENHFFNKQVQDGSQATLQMKSRAQRRSKISKKITRKDSCLKVSRIHQKMLDIKALEKPRRREGLHSMPSSIKGMPLIPFWVTSFDIIENQYEVLTTSSDHQVQNNLHSSESDYLTMRRKSLENEPIYIWET